ncbi:MAG: asparagine synthase (glutamine-hydrolyzing) [Rhodothermales bacterium]|jgi:asparagine synthase (glutamine-hydrolysing)
MCGIAGAFSLSGQPIQDVHGRLRVMNNLQAHRGPDGEGTWVHNHQHVGFGHRRLSIIDLDQGQQPMVAESGNSISYNGEIYNYLELRAELSAEFSFRTDSDTEVILAAYEKWGENCVRRLRGMFAFAIWDEARNRLYCARDAFGIKPFYYLRAGDKLYFSSEAKALLPFLDQIETDLEGFKDYLTFQFCLGGKTLFKHICELLPAHAMSVANGSVSIRRYWEVQYVPDFDNTENYFEEHLRHLLGESVDFHLRSDVPVGAYISGGVDSSLLASLAASRSSQTEPFLGFTGKFSRHGAAFDESGYARGLAEQRGIQLHEADIGAGDFIENIRKVIFHLDYPVAGPGSFSQFMVSRLAAQHRKVVLGGQGGDEVFGGYARYLLAYFEQCIKGAINGTTQSGNFIVTYESIIPNLVALKQYVPMMQQFWSKGLFESMDRRYFSLVNRAPGLGDEINWPVLEPYSSRETFHGVFHGDNVGKESYFDLMTHFDFKTLLPALLHVEDRMSMAHGLESRVPLLDIPIVELAASIPSSIKFRDGQMKHLFRKSAKPYLTPEIMGRKDKMGFPTPLSEWLSGEAHGFVCDLLNTQAARERELVDNRKVRALMDREPRYGRKVWGLLSLEIWQQEFHDQNARYQALARDFD